MRDALRWPRRLATAICLNGRPHDLKMWLPTGSGPAAEARDIGQFLFEAREPEDTIFHAGGAGGAPVCRPGEFGILHAILMVHVCSERDLKTRVRLLPGSDSAVEAREHPLGGQLRFRGPKEHRDTVFYARCRPNGSRTSRCRSLRPSPARAGQ